MSESAAREHEDANDLFLADYDDEDTQANKYLTFKIQKESYGIKIGDVIEIVELQTIIEVPDTPDFIKGVINLRGKIIPVMDIRVRFNINEREYDDRTCIVVVDVKGTTLGLIVDTVEEVVEIFQDNIEPPPRFKKSNESHRNYISGLGKAEDEVKILLDVEKILFNEELEMIGKLEKVENMKVK